MKTAPANMIVRPSVPMVCNWCGAEMVTADRCIRCNTSYPSKAKRHHRTEYAVNNRSGEPRDEDMAGYAANAKRILEDS